MRDESAIMNVAFFIYKIKNIEHQGDFLLIHLYTRKIIFYIFILFWRLEGEKTNHFNILLR